MADDRNMVHKHESSRYLRLRHSFSFFTFGLINNVLYVIILSAALDLLPPSTPKGIIAFCNIAPALVAKVAWPIFSKGQIRYAVRIASCCAMAVTGMILVASFDSLSMRLMGISLASFASGLGEITYLQLSTVYRPASVAGRAVGSFASGTGAAGLVGAFMWWELRGFGVRIGVGISSILPFLMPVMYHLVLPAPEVLAADNDMDILYQPISSTVEEEDDQIQQVPAETATELLGTVATVSLTKEDKLRLVKPLLLKYMLPLFCVYCFEYTINQGVAPTLVWPVPNVSDHAILGRIIHSIRDYYPLWQLVYQTTVFISRSSISLGLPALPRRLIALPAVVQGLILAILSTESAFRIFGDDLTTYSTAVLLVFILISAEGLCGGLAYVNVFYHINQQASPPNTDDPHDAAKAKQEKEFQIGAIGLADSTGILVAALLAVPTEVALCRIQINHGRLLCKDL